ncbi:hypothetical protein DYH09_32030, partial [bacterium CPR1]|nr:hypothetical protein [bacterium CPR1]
MRYRLIAWQRSDGDWENIEAVYEDPDLGVTRFRPSARWAFRPVKTRLEDVQPEVAREPGQQGKLKISPIYGYSGPFDP